jgi:exonuclease SbcC
MKPLTLSIKNFGPYAGAEAKIDFTKLDRFFLISGDTGSGKTSIFDAISYAIYGKPLGTRNGQSLRSQFAPDTESCVVTFGFATLTEEYEVTRSPHWIERKERGTGFRRATDLLVVTRRPLAGGEWRKVTKDANPEGADAVLERAIGFSHDEFSKLVVLPQGQFQQFLEMDSSKREDLLRQLFPVEDHERLAALAAERAKALDQAGRDLGSRQAEVRKTFDPDLAEARQADLGKRQAEEAGQAAKAEAEFERAGNLLTEARLLSGQFEALDGQRNRLEALKAEAEAREAQRRQLAAHGRAIKVKSPMDQAATAHEDRRRAKEALATLTEEFRDARRRVAVAGEAAAGLDTARAELQRQREALREIEARKAKLAELVAVDAEIAKQRKAVADAQKQLDAASAAREQQLDLQRKLDEDEARAQTLRREREAVLARSAALVPFEDGAKRSVLLRDKGLPLARKARDDAGNALEDAQGELAKAEVSLKKAEAARDRDRAAALAERLEPGEPCPVCGSLEHPFPAAFGEEVDPELLSACQSLLSVAHKRLQDTRELQGIKSNDLAQKEADARSLVDALAAAGFASPETLLERLAEAREHDKRLLAELNPLDDALSMRPQVARDLRTAAGTVDDCQPKLAKVSQVLDQSQGGREQIFLAAGSPDDPLSANAKLDRELKEGADTIASENRRIELIEKDAASAREHLASKTAAAMEKEAALLALDQRVETLDAGLAAALVSAGFRDADAVRQALLLDETVSGLGESLKRYDSDIDSTTGAIDSLTRSLEGKGRPDLEALETREAEARASRDAARIALDSARNELNSHADAARRWQELLVEERELRGRGAVFLELSSDLNGLGGEGRPKLGFASFVLGRWLRQVLEHGSRRLSTLSGGRYRFLHNEAAADGRKRAGLEIDVHDSYAGAARGVGTLSGGEKFLASLSLALGLSDVIQAIAGGRRLDALFIDEGFGSLDGDSLDRAIAVLEEIGEGRQVGIISHVESLKKTILSQIRVEKGPAGSRLAEDGGQ